MTWTLKYAVADNEGRIVTRQFDRSGNAIDFAVKSSIRRLRPSKNEKREKWAEMLIEGYRIVIIKTKTSGENPPLPTITK